MRAIPPLVLALASSACFSLSACNARSGPAPVAQIDPGMTAQAPMTAQASGGSGCSASIARYRAVAQSDADTGNAGPSVFKQIDGEIRNAEAACAAGRDAEALRLIASSKARHGYPSGH